MSRLLYGCTFFFFFVGPTKNAPRDREGDCRDSDSLCFSYGEMSCKKNDEKMIIIRNCATQQRLRRWWSECDETPWTTDALTWSLQYFLMKICHFQNFVQCFLFSFATKTRFTCFHSCRLPVAGRRMSLFYPNPTHHCLPLLVSHREKNETFYFFSQLWTQLFRQILFPS